MLVRAARLPALLLAMVLWGSDGRFVRAEEAPPAVGTAVEQDLAELAAPAERTRQRALERLIARLPSSRPAVVAAFESARGHVKDLLVDVLVHDASAAALGALLDALREGPEARAVRIRMAIVRSVEASAAARDLLAGATEAPHGRIADLELLLERAEVEQLFLSRKSRSGMTGSYHGQYEVLRPHRQAALQLCLGILGDRALPVPGVYTTGQFSYVRPARQPIEFGELLGMAAHAFAELAEPTDRRELLDAQTQLMRLDRARQDYNLDEDERTEAFLRYGDLLIALYRIRPEMYDDVLRDHLRDLEFDYRLRRMLNSVEAHRAAVLLRVGRYEDAIAVYQETLDYDVTGSKAGTNYNMACAYAQWGLRTEDEGMRAYRYARALDHLERAAHAHWSDIGWMEEDRDLEPIRDTARYEALRERIREEITPPGRR